MSAKHTPGPWWVEHESEAVNAVVSVSGALGVICELDVAHWPPTLPNACLIAAAPDLLAAARDALAGWRYLRENHGDLYGVGWGRVEDALRAAIAKAEGRE